MVCRRCTLPPLCARHQASPRRGKTLAQLTTRRGYPLDSSAAERSVGVREERCRCDKPRSVVHRLLSHRLRPGEPRPTQECGSQTPQLHKKRPASHTSSVTFGEANSKHDCERTSIPPSFDFANDDQSCGHHTAPRTLWK